MYWWPFDLPAILSVSIRDTFINVEPVVILHKSTSCYK